MFKLALLKALLTLLASMGIFLPSPLHIQVCNPGHGSGSGPSNCEPVLVRHSP